MGNKYRPKCGDALWLEVKAGWLIPFINVWLADTAAASTTTTPVQTNGHY